VRVRDATRRDAAALADLLGQLGYPATSSQVAERLPGVLAGSSVLVAELEGGIAGLLSAHTFDAIEHDGRVCLITVLVVTARGRGRGVGSALLARLERDAADRGCARVVVGTAHHRTEAHAFYRTRGYADTGLRFVKQLA
jgi:GNAT superfamily N-acetyltransferase